MRKKKIFWQQPEKDKFEIFLKAKVKTCHELDHNNNYIGFKMKKKLWSKGKNQYILIIPKDVMIMIWKEQ